MQSVYLIQSKHQNPFCPVFFLQLYDLCTVNPEWPPAATIEIRFQSIIIYYTKAKAS